MLERDFYKKILVVAVAAILVLALAQLVTPALARLVPSGRLGWQAVFLANGQVYFGKITGENDRAVTLGDVFYLKLPKPVLSQEDLQGAEDVSLIKLGNELHGPEDKMEIMRAQILFIEKLKNEGKVVKSIEQYKSSR